MFMSRGPSGLPLFKEILTFFFFFYKTSITFIWSFSKGICRFLWNFRYGIYLAKLQLFSIIIVDVTAVGVINRVGLMLWPYLAWCSAPTSPLGHCHTRYPGFATKIAYVQPKNLPPSIFFTQTSSAVSVTFCISAPARFYKVLWGKYLCV